MADPIELFQAATCEIAAGRYAAAVDILRQAERGLSGDMRREVSDLLMYCDYRVRSA